MAASRQSSADTLASTDPLSAAQEVRVSYFSTCSHHLNNGLAWIQHASEVITKLSRHAASAILAYRPGTYLANWMVKSLCVCCPDCLDVLAGDTTANLWWRIQNGELPRNHQPKLAVVMIGANDLTAAYVQCGTWDQSSYYNAAVNIAQQCVLSA